MCHFQRVCLITLLLALTLTEIGLAQSSGEEEISFQSGDLTLHGTILIPQGEGPWPAVALLHGAGLGVRDAYRPVAEALTENGFVTLVYDKRTRGYSASPAGSRSYSLLADDAVAAVEMLRQRDDVDPAAVGLWGLSEGGWIAPLAATRSRDVAFVITVAGGGIGPAEQSAWGAKEALRHQGVTSSGALSALADRAYRFLVSAEFFSEGLYDPIPVLERLEQPILALWGGNDRLMPAVASANRLKETLDRVGHTDYVIQLFPGADHEVRLSLDGFSRGDTYAPGYFDLMASWIAGIARGEKRGPYIDTLALEEPAVAKVREARGMARWESQLALFVAFHLVFGGYFIAGAFARFKRRRRQSAAGSPGVSEGARSLGPIIAMDVSARRGGPRTGRLPARATAFLGLLMPWAVYGYVGYATATGAHGVGTVVLGRPLGWLLLQFGAATLVGSALVLIVASLRERRIPYRLGRVRFALMLAGIALFVPWAGWWQLFAR